MQAGTDDLATGVVDTWVGTIRVTASPQGVRHVWLPSWRDAAAIPELSEAEHEFSADTPPSAASHQLRAALDELAEYFGGMRRMFTVPLDPHGPSFFRAVWSEVARVPYGETRTYGEIARTVGAPRAVRAVGAANGANPLAPFVPCHRVVGSDGRLVGYGPGLPLKARLLVMEDAMPASAAERPAWSARVAARLGTEQIYLGVRSTGIYCRPNCSAGARYAPRPGRIFRTLADAAAAGFRPCAVCRPDRPMLLAGA